MTIHISTVGIVATAPHRITTTEGVTVCSFRLAVSERKFDKEKRNWQDGGTSWFSVTAFRSLGEHAHESFHVGDRVVVHGRLRTRDWERGDRSGTSVDIDADSLGHDLRWGKSEFTKQPTPLHGSESANQTSAEWVSDTPLDTVAQKSA